MMRMTATQAAREFSDVLNRVAAGEVIEITRNDAPIAVLTPVRSRLLSAARFRALMAAAPPVDDSFAADLREIRASAGLPEPSWPS
jgi:prevent-host-death family protein